jgi:hypothetical protein
MLPVRASLAPTLQQYLNNAFQSPSGSTQEDIGLPLSRISSPHSSMSALRVAAHNFLTHPYSDSTSEPNMRLPPQSSQHLLARAVSLPVPTTYAIETNKPKRAKKNVDDLLSINAVAPTRGDIDCAMAKIKDLIRTYSEKLAKTYARNQKLEGNDLAAIEKSFAHEKNAIFTEHHLPETKINKCNHIINDHLNELSICLKNKQYELAAFVIKSLNENFTEFAND